MDKYAVEMLELKKILNELKNHAETNIGKDIIGRLKPASDISYIKTRLKEVTAGRVLIEQYSKPPFGGISDLREILKKAGKGVVLSTKEITQVRRAIYGFRNIKLYFRRIKNEIDPVLIKEKYDVIYNKSEKIAITRSLEQEIDRVIDDYGEIKDNASSKLSSLRSQIENLENQIRSKLENIIKSSKYQSILQDTLVTRREDRYVIPVKKEYKNSFSGIVHDQSASGMTIFMEPMAVLKLNNRLREVKNEEEREIYRILQQLTVSIENSSDIIRTNLKMSTLLDEIFARASYSAEYNANEPEINKKGIINIQEGRHPLLKNEPVPVSLQVGKDFKTLIITGPNTGGKTVALKTIGLFVLMTECGLHIPAGRKSDISLFDRVYADIGDEQSIEQNLSTFSSHMNHIKYFLENANQDSLILMDELGVGTDPREGAALGIAILEKLKAKNAVTVATTHYSQLKSYAYSSTGVENASVEFDIETLKPTYKLIMGVPGGSNAFEIALRLGLPSEIINKAKELIDDKELKVEDIIDALNRERKQYRQLRKEAEEKHKEVEEMKKIYAERMEKLEEKKKNIIKEAKEEAKKIINNVKKESKNILRGLKEKDFTVRSEVDRSSTAVNEQIKEIESDLKYKEAEEETPRETLKNGDIVRIRSVGNKGKIINIDRENNEATIQAGIIKVTSSLNDLVKEDLPAVEKKEMIKKYKVKKSENVTPSLDLRGERYVDAQIKLEKYLDDVLLAGYKNIEIIHGKGTGALREAVQEILDENPHVSSYRLGRQEEGGRGVTIARIDRK